MLSWLSRLLRGPAVQVDGSGALPDGQARRVSLGDPLAGGTEVILARCDGVLHALDRQCPHEGGRLIDGPLVEGKYVVCPLHSYKFDPATGQAVGVACAPAKVYRVEEKGGNARVWI